MGWRALFFGKRRAGARDSELAKLATSEAMMNRAALNPATLKIHAQMVASDAEEAGRLTFELIKRFAEESGKPMPGTMQASVDFLKRELKGFDTAEAKERAERARLDEIMRILRGS